MASGIISRHNLPYIKFERSINPKRLVEQPYIEFGYTELVLLIKYLFYYLVLIGLFEILI